MADQKSIESYQSYRDLPPLAGLATIAEAARPGLGIEACVARLKRSHYAFVRLHEIFTARITAEPIYELKTAFSHHAYLCAEHVESLRTRVGEMREPPLGLEVVPDPNLEIVFDEILSAATTEELIVGLYEVALPALDAALGRHMADTNPLADAPSVRVCKFARVEVREMLDFGRRAVAALVDQAARDAMRPWVALLASALAATGEIDGTGEVSPDRVSRMRSANPYKYDPVPQRDERFQDLYNQGVNPEAFLYDPAFPDRAKTLMMLFKRLREIDVPEMMGSIIAETKGKPWRYYRDMSRQLWDEARHAMMGEVGFVANGVDWTRARISPQLVAAAQHRMHPDRAPRGPLLHRAGADEQDREAVRVGDFGPRRRPAHGHDPGLRLGRRGLARGARARVVHPPDRALEGGARVW